MSSKLFDVWIKVVRKDCDVTNVINTINIVIKMTRASPGRTMSSHVLKLSYGDPEEIKSQLLRKGIKTVRILSNNTLWVRARSCSACSLLSREDCVVVEGIPLSSYEMSYRLLVPGLGALRDIIKTLASAGLQPIVLKRAEHIEAGELTSRQLEVLLFAYRKGYFDTPRKISLSEMASIMGIRATSLRDIIRRAIKKIVKRYLADIGLLLEE
ncbi:MAG: helix-turn-helix domain-containing protein [Desulfurococcales archaeon]|jgi:predicted DNA binding protein|nr:helix-turn-helix domain-containing protein [Desulfurococcales archaeon]